MKPREVLETATTPDGARLELSREAGQFVIRVGGKVLMSSATSGSERAMAIVARDVLAKQRGVRVLVGGLGMGFTLRAALESFGPDTRVTVAELLPAVVELNRGVLGDLADRPLNDRRVHVVEEDVRRQLVRGGWDVVLLDVDNGPDGLTAAVNDNLYDDRGVELMASALVPGGVLIVWSAFVDRTFERRLRRAGLRCEVRKVHARGEVRKGGRHILYVARAVP